MIDTNINKLSSCWWDIADFTVEFEYNFYDTHETPLSGNPNNMITKYIPLTSIVEVSWNYLNDNFPVSSFNIGTKVAVVLFLTNINNYNTIKFMNIDNFWEPTEVIIKERSFML